MRDYEFGNYIRRCRKAKGLSQFQLGMLLGVTDRAVSKWENGISKPRAELFGKLSRILEIRVEELISHINQK